MNLDIYGRILRYQCFITVRGFSGKGTFMVSLYLSYFVLVS